MYKSEIRGSGLEDILTTRPLDKLYYRAGVICAVLFASTLACTVGYMVSKKVPFLWYTPLSILATATSLALLLTFAYLAVVAAKAKSASKQRTAVGIISANSLYDNTRFGVRAIKQGSVHGYGEKQVVLVWIATLAILTASAALGMKIGVADFRIGGLPKLVSTMIVEPTDVVDKVYRVALIVALCALVALFIARIFVEEGVHNVNIIAFPESGVRIDACLEGQDTGCSSDDDHVEGTVDDMSPRHGGGNVSEDGHSYAPSCVAQLSTFLDIGDPSKGSVTTVECAVFPLHAPLSMR